MQIDLRYATIVIRDGANRTCTIEVGEGSFTSTETRNIEFVRRRGVLDNPREGDEEPVEVAFQFLWEKITSDTDDIAPTPEEALKQIGLASTWTSTCPDPDSPYAVDLVITYQPPCGQSHTIELAQFNYEKLAQSLSDGTIDCSGHCNIYRIEPS